MPYFGNLHHLAPLQPGQGSRGPRTSIMENLGAVFEQQSRVDAEWALEAELVNLYAENLARAAELSGQAIENTLGEGMSGWQFMRDVVSLELGQNPAAAVVENYPWVQGFRQNEERLAELAQQYPGEVKTFGELVEEVKRIRAEIEENTESVTSRGGAAGMVGGFIGGVAGSFTTRDPSLIASMFIPGGGATLARRMLVDAALGGGVELGVQYGSVQPTRAMLGEEPGNPWANAAFAAVGGAVFRGALEGVPAGYRALESRLFPERVQRRMQQEVELTNRQLIERGEASSSPTVRAAAERLRGHEDLIEASPFGDSPAALRYTTEQVDAAWRQFEGLPPRTSTAVNRFMPDADGTRLLAQAETPAAFAGRMAEPELYARFDEAAERLRQTEARVAEAEAVLNERTMADTVGLVDEASGIRVREIQTELEAPALTTARRAELERELAMIVESLGPDVLARAESDARIRPTHELRNARRAAAQERKRFNRLAREVGQVEERFATNETAQPRLTLRQSAIALSEELDATTPKMRLDRARQMIESTRAEMTTPREDGTVDVGGVRMREDFEVIIDDAPVSVRQVLRDLEEDDAMIEAMQDLFAMSFLDCIRTAAETGRITQEKADAASRAFQRHLDAELALGTPEAQAVTQAAIRSTEELANLTAAKKWQRVNELKVAHRLATEIEALPDINAIEQHLLRAGDRLEIAYNRTSGQAMARLDAMLEAYRPRAAGLINPVKNMDEIVDAAYGGRTNDTARELAEQIAETDKFLRKLANSRGAFIPENANRRLPQMHDRMKMKRIGRSMEESRNIWVNDHLDTLDWDMMRYDGRPILPNERVEILERTFDSIVTDGNIRLTPGHTAAEHLATRMNRERFLYYKDADSWKAMNKKYGSGNVFQQMIGTIDAMARDISILEHYGPNPASMLRYQQNLILRRAAEMEVAQPTTRKKSLDARAREALGLFDRRYIIHARNYMNGSENLMATIVGTLRTGVVASTLQGAYVSNLGDLTTGLESAKFYGLPVTGLIRRYLRNFVPNKENNRWNTQSGLIFESAISQVLNNNRFFGPLMGHNLARRFSDTVFRFTWLTQHNQAAKWAWGQQVMGGFAIYRNRGWDALPKEFRDALANNRITQEDWDIFRGIEPDRFAGEEFLRPQDLWESNPEVADKFMDFIYDTGRRAVPEQGTRVQAVLGGHLDRTSGLSQVVQLLNAVKGFPVTIMLLHMRDSWAMATPGQRLKNIVRFFTYLTVGGALITQLRALINGRDPRDMTDPWFWAEAALNGGSFGFLGDAIFNNINSNGGGMADSFAGPVVQFLDRTRNLTIGNLQKMLRGEDPRLGRDVLQYIEQYGVVGWQFRLMFRRALQEHVLREVDPQAYRRLVQNERRRLRETGQDSWWRPGDALPHRAPDFTMLWGG